MQGSSNEHSYDRKTLKYLVNPVALANSFRNGVGDSVGLVGVKNIHDGVLCQRFTIGMILLLTKSSNKAPR